MMLKLPIQKKLTHQNQNYNLILSYLCKLDSRRKYIEPNNVSQRLENTFGQPRSSAM